MTGTQNPLLEPILVSFDLKRKRDGTIPSNWLLIVLKLLDIFRTNGVVITEDDVYTYDYTLKNSRGDAIAKLLEKYGFPKLPLSREGITTRGASGLRVFRALEGGAVMGSDLARRDLLILEAVELVRNEVLKSLGQKPILLASKSFQHSST